MKTFLKNSVIAFGTITSLNLATLAKVYADKTPDVTQIAMAEKSQTFINKKYAIQGNWTIIEKEGQTVLRLSQDFKTKRGPDLKLFLSPSHVENLTGQTATQGSVLISSLNTNRGSQDYIIPRSVNLTDFKSVIIHCEAFSVLWGGGNL